MNDRSHRRRRDSTHQLRVRCLPIDYAPPRQRLVNELLDSLLCHIEAKFAYICVTYLADFVGSRWNPVFGRVNRDGAIDDCANNTEKLKSML